MGRPVRVNTSSVPTARPSLGGVLPVVSVPFTVDWRIDALDLRREIDWLLDQGADGVVVGMVSEVLRLDTAARREVTELVVEHVADRGSTVISVGAESLPTALALAQHASALGASAVMATAPLLAHPDDRALRDYFTQIAEATGDIPLVVQDASGYIGAPLVRSVMIDLLDRFDPAKVQFKPEAEPLGPNVSRIIEATQGRARVFEGSGGLALVESYARGVVGTMPGPDLVWAIVRLWHALQNAEAALADAIGAGIASILAHVSSLDSYIAVEKHMLVEQGVLTSTRQLGPVDYHLDSTTVAELARLVGSLRRTVDQAALSTGVAS